MSICAIDASFSATRRSSAVHVGEILVIHVPAIISQIIFTGSSCCREVFHFFHGDGVDSQNFFPVVDDGFGNLFAAVVVHDVFQCRETLAVCVSCVCQQLFCCLTVFLVSGSVLPGIAIVYEIGSVCIHITAAGKSHADLIVQSADCYDTVSVNGEGKGFAERNFTKFDKVAVVDKTLAEGLFQGESPVGKVIDISGEPFTVIGVAVKNSNFEPVISSVEDYYTYNQTSSGLVFIPTNDWGIVFRYDEPENCIVKAVDTDSMTNAGKKSADILNENVSAVKGGSEETSASVEYKSDSLLEQAKSLQDLSSSTNKMLIWIASISLLVGGIGVMNIMLVSVTERTREIGLKKALGARKKRILAQFLTEAAVLTSIGGIIGVLTGIGLSQVIAKVAEVPVAISSASIVVSVVFSMVVGIVFGLIPSIKAAKLNPIDALRYE